jgi:hypothetical protein
MMAVAAAAAAICLAALQTGTDAATLSISTQNTLHLSASARGAFKRTTFKAQNAKFDVSLLQEVMKTANLADVTPSTPAPGDFVFQDSELKGASSYKERYAVIYKSVLSAQQGNAMYGGLSNAKKFSRSPSASLLKTTSGDLIWFVDFHAIFGKSVGVRRAEAQEMKTAYEEFMDADIWGDAKGVVIAGDWNLDADDSAFNKLKSISTTFQVMPNMDTSLKKNGDPSEPYDHFATDGTKIKLSGCGLVDLPAGTTPRWFRTNVSDHRGVTCTITF